jgi:DNA-binding PadR family transcriptional regulator
MITRTEELILLAVWRLGEMAYSVKIRKELKAVTGQFWSFGAVYMPLDRLLKRGLLESYLTDPTPERGGRSKRIYKPTQKGLEALEEIRRIHEAAWRGTPRRITTKS